MKASWTLSKIWNESLDQSERHVAAPRDRMWASELAKSDVDIYLKMLGTEASNPPNARALRKMEAGNIWEWIIQFILRRCGIYKDSQEYMKTQIEGCVEVSGKLDFIAGGKVSYDQAEALVKDFNFPEVFTRAITNILEYFKANYPDGLDDKILEIKSVSSFGFDKVERTGQPLAGHDLQLYHYLRAKKMDGAIVYIDRDSARMIEMFVEHTDPRLAARYEEKVRRVSDFYARKEQPPKEPLILFDDGDARFAKNFNVEYSSFLTMLYGFADQQTYDDEISPKVERWNRVLGRIKKGDKMTENNEQALAEMTEAGWDVEYIKSKIIAAKAVETNEA